MNDVDKEAFKNWWETTGGGSVGEAIQAAYAWQAALEYRDKCASAVNEQIWEALTLASWALTRENINAELVERKVSAAIAAAKAAKGE